MIKTVFVVALLAAANLSAANWPSWRGGLQGSGVSEDTAVPTRWSATENVRWKVPLPDAGNSTPIIWGDRIFLTQALPAKNQRNLMCLDRKDGKLLWETGVVYAEKDPTHDANPHCSSSPVTDGERVVVWFGSAGLFCYDFQGKELWRRDLGKQTHRWGYGSSPVLYKDICFLNFGPGERSFLLAVDKQTGKTLWQLDTPQTQPAERTDGFAGQKDGVIGSWSTPIIVPADGHDELILTSPEQIRAFDPASGKELWTCAGLNPLLYSSPIFGEGVVVGMGGYAGNTVAIKPGGTGDRSAQKLWQTNRTKNRMGSGVIHNGYIFVSNTPGIAECIELKTGKVMWEERLKAPSAKTETWASMVLVGDRVYVVNQSGDTIVFRASPTFEVISVNSIGGELTNGSLAISNGQIFLRTHKHLWCIATLKDA